MRLNLGAVVACTLLLTATSAFAQDSTAASGAAAGASVQAAAVGVKVTAAIVAVPLRLAATAAGVGLKQTTVGLSEGVRGDAFDGKPLMIDRDIVAQPAPVVPRDTAKP